MNVTDGMKKNDRYLLKKRVNWDGRNLMEIRIVNVTPLSLYVSIDNEKYEWISRSYIDHNYVIHEKL